MLTVLRRRVVVSLSRRRVMTLLMRRVSGVRGWRRPSGLRHAWRVHRGCRWTMRRGRWLGLSVVSGYWELTTAR